MNALRAGEIPLLPDPDAAQLLAQHARRMQSAGRWSPILVGIGAAEAVVGVAMALEPLVQEPGPWTRMALFTVLVAGACLLRRQTSKSLERRMAEGLPKASWPPIPAWLTTFTVAAAASAFLLAAVLTWRGVELDDASGLALVVAINVGLMAALCWYAWRLRLWEYTFAAAGSGASLLVLPQDPLGDERSFAWFPITLGCAYLIAGLFLFARWRKWVASLPKGDVQ